MPEIKPTEVEQTASIKVVGVGGAGGSAISRMKDAGISGVEFIAMNTDAQALHNSKADVKVHLGYGTTNGLGAGADPKVGESAADESREDIKKALTGADMVFVTLGAGGGTGSGASYIIADEAKKQDILVVGVATKPFTFEGAKRKANADWAIDKLSRNVDALITIPNDRLLQTIDPRTPLLETFKIADDVLRQGVQGISELITEHALINLDFADVKSIMRNAGSALMGIGRASGENRAVMAAQQAIESPLIEVSIDGAKGVLFSVVGGYDMSMDEIREAAELITNSVSPDANIIFGASVRPELEDEMIITVIATGFDGNYDTGTDFASREATVADAMAAAEPTETAAKATGRGDEAGEYGDKGVETDERGAAGVAGTASQEFVAENTGGSMWDRIKGEPESGEEEDDADLPAILRKRRRK